LKIGCFSNRFLPFWVFNIPFQNGNIMLKSNLEMTGILLFLVIILTPSLSIAATNLSVNPADGSSSLKLEQAYLGLDNKKDVRVRISSTDGHRYQVFARVLEPIVNEKGESLDLNAVSLATLSNSNTSGSLYLQNENRLSMGEQLIYSSAQNGESDSFLISYALNPEFVRSSGNYFGRIIYTVRSSEGGDSQATLNINVQAKSRFEVTVSGSRAPDRIAVNDKDVTEQTADFVKILFSGNTGQNVRVYQEAMMLPQNAEGTELGAEGLIFYAKAQGSGVRAQDVTSLTQNRSLIYEGNDTNEGLVVYYQLNPKTLGMQAPGTYTGKIKFFLETDQGIKDYFINIICSIQPVFTIDVDVPADGINFNHVIANNPPQEKEILIKVHSNLRKPYQVTQNFQALMTNEKGNQIDKEYFTQKVELLDGSRGRTRFTEYQPVEQGDFPVFVSDSKGNPVTFKITYKLQGYQGMSAGSFNAPVQFSLNQN
jgi:hypothetical protein